MACHFPPLEKQRNKGKSQYPAVISWE